MKPSIFSATLVAVLMCRLASPAQDPKELYWYRYQRPVCVGPLSVRSILTSAGLYTKQLTLEGEYFVVSSTDIAAMPYVMDFETVTLGPGQAKDLRAALSAIATADSVSLLLDIGSSATLGVLFSYFGVPTFPSLVAGASLTAFVSGINASATQVSLFAGFIAGGGQMNQVLRYSLNADGQPTVSRHYLYEVMVGSERRRFMLATCVYAVRKQDVSFAGICPPNPDQWGPTFCRERAESKGSLGSCGGVRLDIDGTVGKCAFDQRPLCDPESFCLCDFAPDCY